MVGWLTGFATEPPTTKTTDHDIWKRRTTRGEEFLLPPKWMPSRHRTIHVVGQHHARRHVLRPASLQQRLAAGWSSHMESEIFNDAQPTVVVIGAWWGRCMSFHNVPHQRQRLTSARHRTISMPLAPGGVPRTEVRVRKSCDIYGKTAIALELVGCYNPTHQTESLLGTRKFPHDCPKTWGLSPGVPTSEEWAIGQRCQPQVTLAKTVSRKMNTKWYWVMLTAYTARAPRVTLKVSG